MCVLADQVDDHAEVLPMIDIDLGSAASGEPGFSRRPDIVLLQPDAVDRLDDPVSLVDCHLAEEFGYQDAGGVTGTFDTTVPFPLRVELDRPL